MAGLPALRRLDRITKVKANPEKRIRVGLWRCGDCKRQFTVKVGTVFEQCACRSIRRCRPSS